MPAGVRMAYCSVALRFSSTEVSAHGDLVPTLLPRDICKKDAALEGRLRLKYSRTVDWDEAVSPVGLGVRQTLPQNTTADPRDA